MIEDALSGILIFVALIGVMAYILLSISSNNKEE